MSQSTTTRRGMLAAVGAGTLGTAGCVEALDNQLAAPNRSGDRTVTMAPTGEVTLDGTPDSVANYFPGYADMAVALGYGDTLNSIGVTNRYYTTYYEELSGVSIDPSSLTELVTDSGIDQEVFYELDSDLHLIDPQWLIHNGFFGFESEDIETLERDVAPFLGNTIFRRTDPWHDYRYYTMYGAFEKVAQVYDARERYEAFKAFHDEFIAELQTALPSADDRPNALLCYAAGDQPDTFSPYRISDQGTNKKQFRDLGITDALSGTGIDGLSTDDRGQIDYETMLSVDPDSILVRGHERKTREEFEDTVLAYMQSDDVAQKLTAVQEGRVFRGGPIYLGPIQHLFLTERFATLYFPDRYSGHLFDRDELARIITSPDPQ